MCVQSPPKLTPLIECTAEDRRFQRTKKKTAEGENEIRFIKKGRKYQIVICGIQLKVFRLGLVN